MAHSADRESWSQVDMHRSGAVGDELGAAFNLAVAPSVRTRSLKTLQMAATEIRCDNPVVGTTEPLLIEDAYLIGLLLRTMPQHANWEDGKALPRNTVGAGSFLLRDLRREQVALVDRPHHSIHLYLPRTTLEDVSEDIGAGRFADLDYDPGVPFDDTVVRHLAAALRPAMARPDEVNQVFLDHVLLAMGAHVTSKYGTSGRKAGMHKGGLATWQETRAKELLAANLEGSLGLKAIAAQCGLSASHFSRAFKRSVGMPPHRWLLLHRIRTAETLLRDHRNSISEIAFQCGFADQSHFSRVFASVTRTTPAAWRRAHGRPLHRTQGPVDTAD